MGTPNTTKSNRVFKDQKNYSKVKKPKPTNQKKCFVVTEDTEWAECSAVDADDRFVRLNRRPTVGTSSVDTSAGFEDGS